MAQRCMRDEKRARKSSRDGIALQRPGIASDKARQIWLPGDAPGCGRDMGCFGGKNSAGGAREMGGHTVSPGYVH
jgi:hypothetical protein